MRGYARHDCSGADARCWSSGPGPTGWRPRPRPAGSASTPSCSASRWVLAAAHAGRDAPALGARLAPRRLAASTRWTPTSRSTGSTRRPSTRSRSTSSSATPTGSPPRRGSSRARAGPRPRAPRRRGLRGAHGGRLDALSPTASSPRRASRASRSSRPLVREALAPGQWSHTARTVEFAGLRGRRCLIVGGRQSAFEWAALLAEAGAARVDVVHRHATPEFTASDWSFVDDLLARTRQTRGWFRGLAEASGRRSCSASGRSGDCSSSRGWPTGSRATRSTVAARGGRRDRPGPGEAITVTLRDGTRLDTDHVLLATGYRVDMRRVPYLAGRARAGRRLPGPRRGLPDQPRRACTSPASPRRATSARSSASWPAPRPPPDHRRGAGGVGSAGPWRSDRSAPCSTAGPSSRARAGTRAAGGCRTSTATAWSRSTPDGARRARS